jgi:hypothetical protein
MAVPDAAGDAVMRRLRLLPALVSCAALASAVAALAALAPGWPLVPSCAAAGSHRAALVVQHGDGSVVTRCVAFDAATITGEGLLDSSGVAWSGQTFGGFGVAVCSLDGEPAHYSTCPGKESYWALFVSRGGGAWQLASAGVSSLTLADGDAEGLRYVPAAGVPAPPLAPAGVCAAAGPSAGATAGASAGPGSKATGSVAAPTDAGATPAGSPVVGAAGPASAAVGGATAATGTGVASATGVAPGVDAAPGSPGSTSGFDPGLLAAAVAGGGLAGLVVLRLAAGRRRVA